MIEAVGIFLGAIALALISVAAKPRVSLVLGSLALAINPAISAFGISIASGVQALGGVGPLLHAKGVFRMTMFKILVLFIVWQVVSLLWSPDPNLVILGIVGTMTFLLYLGSAVAGGYRANSVVRSTLYLLIPVVAVSVVSTIIFRLDSALESEYLEGDLAKVLIGSSARDVATGVVVNNVTSEYKAGGFFFVNGNRASMVFGVCTMVYLALAWQSKNIIALLTSILSGAGVVAAGSKLGWALLIVLPILAMLFTVLTRQNNGGSVAVGVLSGIAVVGIIVSVVPLLTTYFLSVEETLVPRTVLARTAFQFIVDNPLTGLGSGGWERDWPAVAQANNQPTINFPPHNFILAWGVKLGLPGVLLLLAFMWTMLRTVLRGVTTMASARSRFVMLCVAAAWIWVFVHGMGDNTEFYSLTNSVPVLALGTVLALNAQHDSKTASDPPAEALGEQENAHEHTMVGTRR